MLLSFRDEINMQKKADTSPTIYKVKTPSGKWKILDNAEMMFNGVGKVTDPDTNKIFDPKEYVPISSRDFAIQPPKRQKKAEEMSTVEIDQIGFRDTDERPAGKRRRKKTRNMYTQEEGVDDVTYEGTGGKRNQFKNVLNKDDISEVSINGLPLVNFPTSDIVLSMLDRKAFPRFEVKGTTIDIELEKVPEENRRQFLKDFIDNKISIGGVQYKDMDVLDKKSIHDLYMKFKMRPVKKVSKIKTKRKTSMLPEEKPDEQKDKEEQYDYPMLHDQMNMMQER